MIWLGFHHCIFNADGSGFPGVVTAPAVYSLLAKGLGNKNHLKVSTKAGKMVLRKKTARSLLSMSRSSARCLKAQKAEQAHVLRE